MTTAGSELGRRFREVHTAIVHEVQSWNQTEAGKPLEVHGDPSDAAGLATHVAERGELVAALLEKRNFGKMSTGRHHSAPSKGDTSSASALTALASAGAATLRLLDRLSDEDIATLRESSVDGEPDAIDGSCGLVGHWKFHQTAIREVR